MNTARRSFSIAGADLCGLPRALAASAFLVRTIRRERGWSKKEMGRQTGINTSLIYRYERGDYCPSAANWDRIFKAAGIDPALRGAFLAAAGVLAAGFSGMKASGSAAALDSLYPDLQELLRTATRLLAQAAPAEPAQDPADLLQGLRSCERSLRSEVIRITPEFHSPALARLACEQSIWEAARDPQAAQELAEIAVAVAKAGGRVVLEEVRNKFLAQADPMVYDGALAGLELSELLLREGRFAEVREMTGGLVTLFESKGIHREVLAALQLFHKAVVLEAATADFAHAVVTYLYRARYDAELQFKAPQ